MVKEERLEIKEKEKEKERNILVGVVWKCAVELKLLLIALLLLFSIIIILQFLPSYFSISSPNLLPCTTINLLTNTTSNQTTPNKTSSYGSKQEKVMHEGVINTTNPNQEKGINTTTPNQQTSLPNGVIKRSFQPYGKVAYNFILMSSYRGGLNNFAIIGLASKPLLVFSNPLYQCKWIPSNSSQEPITTIGSRILPDWGFGRVYTVVVINCTFATPVVGGGDGELHLLATTNGGGGDSELNSTDTFVALSEKKQDFDEFKLKLSSEAKYDYLYCGSPLYGDLSPQRMREWIAYHVRLFGEKSHFVIHDAGGIHEEVLEVLKPWMEKGYVTLQDIRGQERYDGYYHNQFLVVNDCLHRHRFMTKWIFFFDVDEFLFIPEKSTIKSVVDSLSEFTQFTIPQITMSNKLCIAEDPSTSYRKWGFEKLVYRDVKRGVRRDRKYAVQPRNVFSAGVHMSENFVGKKTYVTGEKIMYYHYHGTISDRRDPCRKLINTTTITLDGTPYIAATSMRDIADEVKRFELKMIGPILQRTRQ